MDASEFVYIANTEHFFTSFKALFFSVRINKLVVFQDLFRILTPLHSRVPPDIPFIPDTPDLMFHDQVVPLLFAFCERFDLSNVLMFNCYCCDCHSIPAVWVHLVAVESAADVPLSYCCCSAVSDRLHHLLLLRPLLLEPLLNDSQHLRRFHGVVRPSVTHASVDVALLDLTPLLPDLVEIYGEQHHMILTAC